MGLGLGLAIGLRLGIWVVSGLELLTHVAGEGRRAHDAAHLAHRPDQRRLVRRLG